MKTRRCHCRHGRQNDRIHRRINVQAAFRNTEKQPALYDAHKKYRWRATVFLVMRQSVNQAMALIFAAKRLL